MTDRELHRRVLDVIASYPDDPAEAVIEVMREAMSRPDEAVAWRTQGGAATTDRLIAEVWRDAYGMKTEPLYTSPAPADAAEIERLREQLVKANACLRQIIEADDEFRMGLPDDWEGDPLSDAVGCAKVLLSDDLRE